MLYVTQHWATKTFPDQDKTDTETVLIVAAGAVVAVADVRDADAVVAGDGAGLQAVLVVATFVPVCCSSADIVLV